MYVRVQYVRSSGAHTRCKDDPLNHLQPPLESPNHVSAGQTRSSRPVPNANQVTCHQLGYGASVPEVVVDSPPICQSSPWTARRTFEGVKQGCVMSAFARVGSYMR
jgi:hypothetical protein